LLLTVHILSYIIALSSILFSLIFFKIWHSGKYFKVALISLLIRLLLTPLFEIYSSKIIPAEIPELLQWFVEWQKYTEIEGFKNIILNPFGIVGARGMYLYYTMYAGWLLDWTDTKDMIPLRLFTCSLSLYIIVFATKLVKWIYNILLTEKQLFFIVNWPFWLYYSIMLGRTMPSVIIPMIGILATYKLLEKFSIQNLLLVLFTFWLTVILRTFYSFFFLSTFLSLFIYKILFIGKKNEQILQKIILMIFSVIFLISLSNLFNVQDAFNLIADNLAESDQVEGEGTGSSYLTSFYPQKYTDLLYYMPVQGIYFLLSPMFWNISKLEQLLSCLFALLLLLFFLKMIIEKDNYYRNSIRAKIFILNMIIICMILGSGVKNAGAAQRWRLPITIIILCVTLPNLINPKKKV